MKRAVSPNLLQAQTEAALFSVARYIYISANERILIKDWPILKTKMRDD